MTISLRVRVRQTAPPIVQDEGVDIASRERLNFIGAGVTVTDDAANGRVNVEIPGGGGGGGGGGTVPTGTGFTHITAGAQDAAAKKVDLAATDDVTGTLAVTNGGTGVTTSTGTGSTVRATSPTLVTPTLGAASATSLGIAGGPLSIHGVGSAVVATIGDVRVGSGWTMYGYAAGPSNRRLFHWSGTDLSIGEAGGLSNVVVYGESGITLAIAGTTKAILDSSGLKLGDGFRILLSVPVLTANRTLSFPTLTGDDTLVSEAHTQTLSNKTFVAPVLGDATATSLAFGTPVPAAGQFRSAYGSASWRGHNSVANESYIVHYEGDGLFVGTGASFTGTTQAGSLHAYAFGTVGLGIGGSTYIYITNAGVIEAWKPRIGSSSGASPYASDGEAPLAGDADATLTASQYSRHAIDISGTTATRTFTFPHPAAQDSSYKKFIINRTANNHTISTGTGTTASVPAGVLKYVWFSPSGADAA